ncbi:MAG: hypothetical protein QM503_05555 [Bacteroidota bacterium]
MKHTIYLILLSLLTSSAYSQDTLTKYFDEDWNIITDESNASYFREYFKNDKSIWVVNDFYMDNEIQMSGLYKTSSMLIKEGVFTYYYENGQRKSSGIYHKNRKSGEWNYWFENGEIKANGVFTKDKKSGEWNYWYDNGQLDAKGQILKNLYTGEWIYWFKNGSTLSKGKFIKGSKNGPWTYWNKEGRKMTSGSYTNGFKEGVWIRYFRDGQMKINYIHGEVIGKQHGIIIRRVKE